MRAFLRRLNRRITVALCNHQWTIPQIVDGRMRVCCFKCDTLSAGVEVGKKWRDSDQLSRPETTNREAADGSHAASAETAREWLRAAS